MMRAAWSYEERKLSVGMCVKGTRCRERMAFGVKDWRLLAYYRCHSIVLGTLKPAWPRWSLASSFQNEILYI